MYALGGHGSLSSRLRSRISDALARFAPCRHLHIARVLFYPLPAVKVPRGNSFRNFSTRRDRSLPMRGCACIGFVNGGHKVVLISSAALTFVFTRYSILSCATWHRQPGFLFRGREFGHARAQSPLSAVTRSSQQRHAVCCYEYTLILA